MITKQLLISGFGGQGLLFMGKALAYKWLLEGYNVSWLPSYGPEMRGGTANCGVVVSENHLIGSPLVANPNVLVYVIRSIEMRLHISKKSLDWRWF